jgi:hypothetical protein
MSSGAIFLGSLLGLARYELFAAAQRVTVLAPDLASQGDPSRPFGVGTLTLQHFQQPLSLLRREGAKLFDEFV